MAGILLVADDPSLQEILSAARGVLGKDVRVAAGGAAGLQDAVRTPPELVVIEMNMSVMNGYDVATRLKAHPATESVPILALASHASIADYLQTRAAGCDGFLPTPVSAARLAEKIRHLLILSSLRQICAQNGLE